MDAAPEKTPDSTGSAPTANLLSLPLLLSLQAGYVDSAGFLALQGLFTAHVTGNFVTVGSAVVFGTSGVLLKLLALPVFCAVIVVVRLIAYQFEKAGTPVMPRLLSLQTLLLLAGAVLAVFGGPFESADTLPALAAGLTLVAAMAIQNAAHRVYLPSAPPSTLMTGTTTQIMLDTADLLHGTTTASRAQIRLRLTRMSQSVAYFAAGCALGAVLFTWLGEWCFAFPPAMCFCLLFAHEARQHGTPTTRSV